LSEKTNGLRRFAGWRARPEPSRAGLPFPPEPDGGEHLRDPQHGPALAFNVGPDGMILYVHRFLLSAPVEDVYGTSIFEHMAPQEREGTRALLARVFASAEPAEYECRGFLPFAEDAWYRCRIAPIIFGGTAVAVTIIMQDITRWKRAEEELRHERERLMAQIELLSAEHGRLDQLSADVARLTAALLQRDQEREQGRLRGERDKQHLDQLSTEIAQLTAILAERDRERERYELDQIKERLAAATTTAQHTIRWQRAEAQLHEELAKHRAERERVSDELATQTYWLDCRDRELNRFRAIVNQAGEAILLIDPETGRLVDANETACRWLGHDRERLLTLSTEDLNLQFPVDVSDERPEHVVDTRKSDRPQILRDGVVRRRNGTTFPVEVAIARLRIGDRDYTLAVAREANARKRAEEALRESEEKFRNLLDLSRDAIYLTARDGTIADINAAAVEFFGYPRDEFLGLQAKKLYRRADDIQAFQRAVDEHGSVRELPVDLHAKDGTSIRGLLTATLRHAGDRTVLGYQCIIRPLPAERLQLASGAGPESQSEHARLAHQGEREARPDGHGVD